jgi:lipopolysaccharide export system permease protein
MFIFIFQTIWLFIDDLAGKGLDFFIILKFLFYLMPDLTEKVLPLTVLLSSILTFGTFAENYEFAAMKASGISLQRSMKSLIVFVTLLGGLTFYFANDVIPISQQKIYNLRKGIAQLKPAAVITEGVFNDFEGGMNIKVKRKHGDEDRLLEDVLIHVKDARGINKTVIQSETGELVSEEGNDILQLILRDGHYYDASTPTSPKKKRKYPFAKADFDVYTFNIDLSEVNNQDLEKDQNITTHKMKNVGRLRHDIDSLRDDNLKVIQAFSKNISNRMGAFVKLRPNTVAVKPMEHDTLTYADSLPSRKGFLGLFKEWEQVQLINSAKNSTSNILSSVKGKRQEIRNRKKIYNLHISAMHKKYALAFSCIILFFVGAPLGAIIRKGGIGLPMVIAIILFLVYYFLGVFAENYSKEGNIHPIMGAWLSTLVMLPLGVFLTRRATADKGMVKLPSFKELIGDLFKRKKSKEEE